MLGADMARAVSVVQAVGVVVLVCPRRGRQLQVGDNTAQVQRQSRFGDNVRIKPEGSQPGGISRVLFGPVRAGEPLR